MAPMGDDAVPPEAAPQLTVAEVEERLELLKKRYQAEGDDIARSERLQQQLRMFLGPLQQQHDALKKERESVMAEIRGDAEYSELQSEVEESEASCQQLQARHAELAEAITRCREESSAEAAKAEAFRQSIEDARQLAARMLEERDSCRERLEAHEAKIKSMVAREALERAKEQAKQAEAILEEREREASKLRQALADSWAARADLEPELVPASPGNSPPRAGENGGSANGDLSALDSLEQDLEWLSKMQQASQAEVHHLQHLERTEARLQAELRGASEEMAMLQSARVDLGGTGQAMREALAVQSEGYVRRVGDLEEERRTTDADRVKLMQEASELQLRLDEMSPDLTTLCDVESRHANLDAERKNLADESERLRTINGALGALLLGDEGDAAGAVGAGAGAMASSLIRVLQLQARLAERREAQSMEKQKLVDRIRQLEREAAHGGGAVCFDADQAAGSSSAAPGGAASQQERGGAGSAESSSASSKGLGSKLRSGFGKLVERGLPGR